MKAQRFLSCLFGALVFSLAGLVYWNFLHFMGFPDGHRTDLDQAQVKLFSFFIAGCIPIGSYSLKLGWSDHGENTYRKLLIAVFCFAILVVTTFSINHYLSVYLDHGAGG